MSDTPPDTTHVLRVTRMRPPAPAGEPGYWELADGLLTIGRGDDNHIVVDDKVVSRTHCLLFRSPQGYKVLDISQNGTLAGTEQRARLTHARAKAIDDQVTRLQIGDVLFSLSIGERKQGVAPSALGESPKPLDPSNPFLGGGVPVASTAPQGLGSAQPGDTPFGHRPDPDEDLPRERRPLPGSSPMEGGGKVEIGRFMKGITPVEDRREDHDLPVQGARRPLPGMSEAQKPSDFLPGGRPTTGGERAGDREEGAARKAWEYLPANRKGDATHAQGGGHGAGQGGTAGADQRDQAASQPELGAPLPRPIQGAPVPRAPSPPGPSSGPPIAPAPITAATPSPPAPPPPTTPSASRARAFLPGGGGPPVASSGSSPEQAAAPTPPPQPPAGPASPLPPAPNRGGASPFGRPAGQAPAPIPGAPSARPSAGPSSSPFGPAPEQPPAPPFPNSLSPGDPSPGSPFGGSSAAQSSPFGPAGESPAPASPFGPPPSAPEPTPAAATPPAPNPFAAPPSSAPPAPAAQSPFAPIASPPSDAPPEPPPVMGEGAAATDTPEDLGAIPPGEYTNINLPPATQPQAPVPPPVASPSPTAALRPADPVAQVREAASGIGLDEANPFRILIDAAIQGTRITPADWDAAERAAMLGRLLREMLEGYRRLLDIRKSTKFALGIERTTFDFGGNNALKYGDSYADIMRNILEPDPRVMKPADISAREVSDDLVEFVGRLIQSVYQMKGLASQVLSELDPAQIEKDLATANSEAGWFSPRKKTWEAYREKFEQLQEMIDFADDLKNVMEGGGAHDLGRGE